MFDPHECQICRTVKTGPEGLCQPEPKYSICAPQTDKEENRAAQCEAIRAKTEHYCGGCGRPSTEPAELCIPQRYSDD